MRFLIHGSVDAAARAALQRHEHACHEIAELPPELTADSLQDDPGHLLPALEKKQWCLLTTESALVRAIYEKKLSFNGVVVQILDSEGNDHAPAIDRLFERYKRLTPGRLYTVTPNRVKIRQLPAAYD